MVLEQGRPVNVSGCKGGFAHVLAPAYALGQPGHLRRLQLVAHGLNALHQHLLRDSFVMPVDAAKRQQGLVQMGGW